MLISTVQNAVRLSPAETQCKWAALANWQGKKKKNSKIDLLQGNRNKDIKGLHLMVNGLKTAIAVQAPAVYCTGSVDSLMSILTHMAPDLLQELYMFPRSGCGYAYEPFESW